MNVAIILVYLLVLGFVALLYMLLIDELIRSRPPRPGQAREARMNAYNQQRTDAEWQAYKRNIGWTGD
jgi:hypothetical protein